MVEFKTAARNASVMVNVANFDDAMELKNAVFREVSKEGIKIEDFLNATGSTKEISLDQVVKTVMQIDSSPFINAALFKCFMQCTYNGEKITKKTFDSAEAREDYYEIAIAVLKENLTPFFKGLLSRLGGLSKLNTLITPK